MCVSGVFQQIYSLQWAIYQLDPFTNWRLLKIILRSDLPKVFPTLPTLSLFRNLLLAQNLQQRNFWYVKTNRPGNKM